ncbi:hypothetical protein M9458_043331, partial [Cirrhinus mrigala]
KRLLLWRGRGGGGGTGEREAEVRAPGEQSLLRQCGNTEEASVGADTAAAGGHYCGSVEIQRKLVLDVEVGFCGSGHCCSSEE